MKGGPGGAALLLTAALLLPPQAGQAQVKASEAASVRQTVDGTELTVEYSRPSLRGRGDLFGGQIPWGLVWTPGANQATTFEASQDVTVGGVSVPAGRYSVWMVVAEDPQAWELVLDPRANLYHTAHPGPTDEQVRVPVVRQEAESFLETLTWYFPAVRATGTDLRLHWGTTLVELEVGVEPSVRSTMPREAAEPYTGEYRLVRLPSEQARARGMQQDTTRLVVAWEEERLLGHWHGLDPTDADFVFDFVLLPEGGGFFQMGALMDGELAEVFPDSFWEFIPGPDGRATSVEVRDGRDVLDVRGWRSEPGSG